MYFESSKSHLINDELGDLKKSRPVAEYYVKQLWPPSEHSATFFVHVTCMEM